MKFYQVALILMLVHLTQGEFLGKFVFHSNSEESNGKASLAVYHKPESIHFAPSPGTLPADEISSVLTLSLGLSIPKDITWNGLLAGSLFQRPKAVMMISVENLPKGTTATSKASQRILVELNDDVSSVGDAYLMSSKQSLTSHVNKIMHGGSTTYSISADEQTAAMGFSRGDQSKTAFWSDMTDSWKSVDGEGHTKEGMTKHAVYKRISQLLPKGFIHQNEEKKVVVNTKDLQVTFDLKNQVDFNIFSELVFMKSQYEELSNKKNLVVDGAPDVCLLSISALKGIEQKYGENSKQMKAALLLLDAVIPQLVADYQSLYKGDILIVGLNLHSDASAVEKHQEDLQHVLKSLKEQFGQEFKHIVPELHSSKVEKSVHKNLCGAVQGAIARFAPGLKFKCNDEGDVAHKVYRRSLVAADKKTVQPSNLASRYDSMFPVIFNIWFWLLVILALATYAISVAMWNMDPGRDSIIYRLTEQKIKSD